MSNIKTEDVQTPNFFLYRDSVASSWGHRLKLCWVDPAFICRDGGGASTTLNSGYERRWVAKMRTRSICTHDDGDDESSIDSEGQHF
jgi:hypothetical protein